MRATFITCLAVSAIAFSGCDLGQLAEDLGFVTTYNVSAIDLGQSAAHAAEGAKLLRGDFPGSRSKDLSRTLDKLREGDLSAVSARDASRLVERLEVAVRTVRSFQRGARIGFRFARTGLSVFSLSGSGETPRFMRAWSRFLRAGEKFAGSPALIAAGRPVPRGPPACRTATRAPARAFADQ
jgi:hypothetical protein